MTDRDHRRFAMAIADGRAYTTGMVPSNLWHLVFMPLFFAKRRDLRHVRMVLGIVGEHQTTGQAVNGYPIFIACQLLKARDTKRVIDYSNQFIEARRAMLHLPARG